MKRPFFFHHKLGYEKNPFGALTREEWTAVSFLPPALEEILTEPFVHLQLLGREGCGKTSTMLHLMSTFDAQITNLAYEYIPEGTTKFATDLAACDIFFLDEAQRLNWWQRRRWLKFHESCRFVFSSHRDFTAVFRKQNLALQTIDIEAQITPAYYQKWLDQRLAYFALPHVPRVQFDPQAAPYLYANFGSNIREAEYFLYDVWQTLSEPQIVTEQLLHSCYDDKVAKKSRTS